MALYKRGGGIWYFVFHIDGRRYKGCTSQHDKGKARAFEDAAKGRIRHGEPLSAPVNKAVPTFKEYAEAYLTGDGAQKKSTKDDRSILDRALIPFFGSMYLDEIQRADVERFRNERIAGKLIVEGHERKRKGAPAPQSVKNELALLKRILGIALDAGLVGRNMARGVKMQKFNNGRDRVIDAAELGRLLLAASTRQAAHMRAVIILGHESGMREGEILALRWADVRAGYVHVTHSKNGDARDVPLSTKAEAALREWGHHDPTWVFPAPNGDGHRGLVSRAFARIAARAKVAEVRFHDLRHTFATHFIEATGDHITLMAILGHRSPSMTKRYSHPSLDHKIASVLKIAASPQKSGLEPSEGDQRMPHTA